MIRGTHVSAMTAARTPQMTNMLYTPILAIHGGTAKIRAVAIALRINTTPTSASPRIYDGVSHIAANSAESLLRIDTSLADMSEPYHRSLRGRSQQSLRLGR